jgi:hypothetical protein
VFHSILISIFNWIWLLIGGLTAAESLKVSNLNGPIYAHEIQQTILVEKTITIVESVDLTQLFNLVEQEAALMGDMPRICKKLKNLLADSNHCEQIVQMSNRRLQRTEKRMNNLNLRISFKNRKNGDW